jgi:DNA-binding GntR family transcriptional regulator
MASPMYRLIDDDLRQKIASGQLPSGGQLATELELREHYGASRNIVRDAIRWLINLGLVETRPGQGTVVVEARNPVVTALTGDATTGADDDEGISYRSETVFLADRKQFIVNNGEVPAARRVLSQHAG